MDILLSKTITKCLQTHQETGKFKTLVVDDGSLVVLNETLTMDDLLLLNISAVEKINVQKRSSVKDYIYILDDIFNLIPELGITNVIHAYSLGFITQQVRFDIISAGGESITTLESLYIDFKASDSFFHFNGSLSHCKLLSLLISLGDSPQISFFDPQSTRSSPAAHFASNLFSLVKDHDRLSKVDSFSNQSRLIIFDRSFDPISPFQHSFMYHALIKDLLGDNGNKVLFGNQDDMQSLDLSFKDPLWNETRSLLFFKASEFVSASFKTFLTENQDAIQVLNGGKILFIKKLLELKIYQTLFEAVSKNLTLRNEYLKGMSIFFMN